MADEQMEEIVNKLKKPDLRISRVPKQTLEVFKKYADEEFCGDYGMCLKWLVDMVFGEFSGAISDINKRLEVLESKQVVEQPKAEVKKEIKTNGGLVINEVMSE